MSNKPYVVIDNGTGYCKAGFSEEGSPKVVLPTVVGRPKSNNSNDFYVGHEA
jgi:actin beta/gamma 1